MPARAVEAMAADRVGQRARGTVAADEQARRDVVGQRGDVAQEAAVPRADPVALERPARALAGPEVVDRGPGSPGLMPAAYAKARQRVALTEVTRPLSPREKARETPRGLSRPRPR